MLVGKVKWFNPDYGYGFIQIGRGQRDVFVHYSVIQIEGYRTLRQGQKVGFEIARGPKGDHATIVVLHRPQDGEGAPMPSEPREYLDEPRPRHRMHVDDRELALAGHA